MKRKNRSGIIWLLLLAGIIIGAYLTNPNEEMHKEASKLKMDEIVENTLGNYGLKNNLISSIGLDIKEKFTDQLIDNQISADNYRLFSLTKLKWEDKEYVIGVGVFNKVFISKKVDDIAQKAIKDFMKNKLRNIMPWIDKILENTN